MSKTFSVESTCKSFFSSENWGKERENWQCVKTLYPFCSHQNSWDLWMFIPLKMVLIGIDPYPTGETWPTFPTGQLFFGFLLVAERDGRHSLHPASKKPILDAWDCGETS